MKEDIATNRLPTPDSRPLSFETIYPDDSFSQFGGHVLERLFQTKYEMARMRDQRFTVRVTIETHPIDAPSELDTCATVAQRSQRSEARGQKSDKPEDVKPR